MTLAPETPAAGREKFLDLNDITIKYGEKTAVDDVSLSLGAGEFISIIGPSGCGKSTFLNVLAGLQKPAVGSVNLTAQTATSEITETVGKHLRAGYVFQDHRLLPWRTVTSNLEIAMKSAGIPKDEWAGRIDRYLGLLQVKDFAAAWPMNLSGGQRQRVSIARALCVSPDVVLMDEPFSGLDEVTGRTIRVELDKLRTQEQTPTIFVTHSIREALYLSDRVVVLSRGPARVLKEIPVDLPRPRTYGDPRLVQLEEEIVSEVLQVWEAKS
ncbi:ABC transporter ATP-binding protein [Nesterenkonia populi]